LSALVSAFELLKENISNDILSSLIQAIADEETKLINCMLDIEMLSAKDRFFKEFLASLRSKRV
jgi:hypothetical protein